MLNLLLLEIQADETGCRVCALHKGSQLRSQIWLKLYSILSCLHLMPCIGTDDCIYQEKR